jgi:serine/threonine protein kinase
MLGEPFGPYRILGKLGAGGMGEVYRARDTKLNRDVAIKVLPAAFADDPERLARFTREAQTLASLNHPNIAAIYGIEDLSAANESGAGSRALVMELVEGEDLSTHIARGPIPIAEALPIARQIAEALEAAHEQGIVHRDLKPANIKVRSDGTVKVLDFGLAKAMDPAGGSASIPNASHSPTLTHQGASAGMIIGTAAYMSPEQAKGKAVDKRTDIWAFGVVLYEMLTGARAFAGDDLADVLSRVLQREPDLTRLPPQTPPRLQMLVARCLVKDPRQRLRDMGDVGLALEGAFETPAPQAMVNSPRKDNRLVWASTVAGRVSGQGCRGSGAGGHRTMAGVDGGRHPSRLAAGWHGALFPRSLRGADGRPHRRHRDRDRAGRARHPVSHSDLRRRRGLDRGTAVRRRPRWTFPDQHGGERRRVPHHAHPELESRG